MSRVNTGLYANKSDIARFFGISRQTVYKHLAGIEREMKSGRYSQYAVVYGLISKAVMLDYIRNRKALENPKLRKYVPQYNEYAAIQSVGGHPIGIRIGGVGFEDD